MKNLKRITDRPMFMAHVKNFDLMVAQLSPYLTDEEVDKLVTFMEVLQTTQHDTNPSINDCKEQILAMIGETRYKEVTAKWAEKNQKLLQVYGKKKYKHKETGVLYDGLDPEDKIADYEVIYV